MDDELLPPKLEIDEAMRAEWREGNFDDFLARLHDSDAYAKFMKRTAAVIGKYASGVPVDQIIDECGCSRTELAFIVRSSGVRRGMQAMTMTTDEVANLYSMLYAAQVEIDTLRHRIRQLERPL